MAASWLDPRRLASVDLRVPSIGKICLQAEREDFCARLRMAGLIDAKTKAADIDLDVARSLLRLRQPEAASPSHEANSPVADVSSAHDLLHLAGACWGVNKLEAVQQLCYSPWSRQPRWPVSAG